MKRLLITIIFTVFNMASAHAALPVAVDNQPLPSLAPMLERVQQSVVRVSVFAQSQMRRRNDPFFNDPFFNRFFEKRRSPRLHTNKIDSTGVIIDAQNGLVLTNQQLLVGARKILITLADGREVEGQIIGSDKSSDVAIIKIQADNLSAIALGDSASLRVGDFVVSIGDPIANQNTLTSGIISALSSRRAAGNTTPHYQNFIQSDAGHGPGILVNLRGELIGLNISKVAQTLANSRIGFSTPVNMALKIKNQLLKYGTPQRGFLAVQVQNLTPDLANAFAINETSGVVVTSVTNNSSAAQAGLRIGDVIVKAGQAAVNRGGDLSAIISQHFAGDSLDLSVVREGQPLALPVILESSTEVSSTGTMIHPRLDGASFKELDAQPVSTNSQSGVMVSRVKKGSVAWVHGVRPNDLIVSANRQPVTNMQSLKRAIARQDVLMLNIVRGNGALFLLLQ